jgi:hypothetical protein
MDNRLNQLAGLIEQLRSYGTLTYVNITDVRPSEIATHVLRLEGSKFIMSAALNVYPYGLGSYSYEFILSAYPNNKPWEVNFLLRPSGGHGVFFKDAKDADRLIALREMSLKLQTVLNLKA